IVNKNVAQLTFTTARPLEHRDIVHNAADAISGAVERQPTNWRAIFEEHRHLHLTLTINIRQQSM
ncbi:hypothetical protein O5264_28510, partial [Escherichia coli]|nr:hypothetical protein [Escherichia coli]